MFSPPPLSEPRTTTSKIDKVCQILLEGKNKGEQAYLVEYVGLLDERPNVRVFGYGPQRRLAKGGQVGNTILLPNFPRRDEIDTYCEHQRQSVTAIGTTKSRIGANRYIYISQMTKNLHLRTLMYAQKLACLLAPLALRSGSE